MGKHIDKKTKYHYVMRYINGESPTKLGMEINPWLRDPKNIILRWSRQYNSKGYEGLESKTGKGKGKTRGRPKKKHKWNYDDMSREELIKHIKIRDYYIDEMNKRNSSGQRFSLVSEIISTHRISIKLACIILKVSKSGYYSWIKRGRQEYGQYDIQLLNLILEIFNYRNKKYGAERIMGELISKYNIKRNIKTIRRYMEYLGIRSTIRDPQKRSKKSKEIKDTKDVRRNFINGNFKQDTSRIKLFTDTTEFQTSSGKVYISAVVGANKNLYSINISKRNDSILVNKDISEAIKKVGKKFFIQFDNAAFYKNKTMENIIKKHKGISSFGKAGESKANWPIENFWSILKQEYLKNKNHLSFKEINKLLFSVYFDYNHKRIQKNLKWKTPAQARV